MSASSSVPPGPRRGSCSCAPTCRGVRAFGPWWPIASRCRGGPCFAPARASVDMIEHVMAALAGMHVDNCEVWVDQPEMPGCDGSAQAFVAAIQQAGIDEQDAAARASRRAAGPAAGQRRMLDRGPPGGRRQDRHPLRIGLRQRQSHRPAVAGSDAFSPLLPPQPGRQPHVHAAARGRRHAGNRGWGKGPPSATCWSSTRTARSATRCGSPTSACATRSSTWSATSPWPAAIWPDVSPLTAADIASTPRWCGRCWTVPPP